MKDLEDIGLKLNVKDVSKPQFRKFVKNKLEALALKYLTKKKLIHIKSKEVKSWQPNNG